VHQEIFETNFETGGSQGLASAWQLEMSGTFRWVSESRLYTNQTAGSLKAFGVTSNYTRNHDLSHKKTLGWQPIPLQK